MAFLSHIVRIIDIQKIIDCMFSFLRLNIYTFSIFLEWITVSLDKKKKKNLKKYSVLQDSKVLTPRVYRMDLALEELMA